eukprot:SAG25_NODE_194_length_12183_cov_70.943893_5_plen_55_part_00
MTIEVDEDGEDEDEPGRIPASAMTPRQILTKLDEYIVGCASVPPLRPCVVDLCV